LQRTFGTPDIFYGDLDMFEDLIAIFSLGTSIYLYKGGWIESRKANLLDRLADWFRQLKG
jgi:hypothetical protein